MRQLLQASVRNLKLGKRSSSLLGPTTVLETLFYDMLSKNENNNTRVSQFSAPLAE